MKLGMDKEGDGPSRHEAEMRGAVEEIGRLLKEVAALRARVAELTAAVVKAHADIGADCGVTEMDCQCDICAAARKEGMT